MSRHPARLYTAFVGGFLLLQGLATLAFRLVPALDRWFPPLLAVTQMVPPHSLLHILTGALALLTLTRGGERAATWYAAGFGVFYCGLAALGMITMHPTMFGLQPFDHPFHILVGGLGLAAAALAYRADKQEHAAV